MRFFAVLTVLLLAVQGFAEDEVAPPAKQAIDTPLQDIQIKTKSVPYRIELELDSTGKITSAKVHTKNCLMDAQGQILASGDGPSISVDAAADDTAATLSAKALAK